MTMKVVRRKIFRAGKYLIAGVLVYFVVWIASITQWSDTGAPWSDGGGRRERYSAYEGSASTIKTIVAYSEGKQAEMDRPALVSCDDLPRYPKVPVINRTWSRDSEADAESWQTVTGTDVSLYAAYYDMRVTGQPYVRILATFKGQKWDRPQLYCQTRSRNPTELNVEVVAAKVLEIWRNEWDSQARDVEMPILLSCSLTEELQDISIVSVVQQPCYDPDNAFVLDPFEYNEYYERNFTVCVKDMNFKEDKSQRLIEWTEANKILGAEMIDIYVDTVSAEMKTVLEFYRDRGTVRLFTVPINNNHRSLWQRRRDHIITYNDCLYRNIKESKFIIPIDIDEVIVPKIASNWETLIPRFERLGYDSTMHSAIVIHNLYFFDIFQTHAFENKNTVTSKPYTKRDDVRLNILTNNKISLNEIVVQYDNNFMETVIDNKREGETLAEYNNMYESRCKTRMPTSLLLSHSLRSSVISPVGHFSKSMMITKKVLTAFNHYPLVSLGTSGFGGWPAPFDEVQMNHYKEECDPLLVPECSNYMRSARVDRTAARLGHALLRSLAGDAPCVSHVDTVNSSFPTETIKH